MAEHTFKIGDWVTWKDLEAVQKDTGMVNDYGRGPFKVGDVRGNTLGIIHYFGFSRRCHWLRHETGMSASFFKPSDPPKDDNEGAIHRDDQEEPDFLE